jgi:hypothetical protein
MFPTLVNAEYADVFLNTSPNPTFQMIAYIVIGVGILILLSSMLFTFSDESFPVLMIGFVVAMLGVMALPLIQLEVVSQESKIMENMVSNVKEKYNAELQVSREQITGLEKYNTYTLEFDNGATGEYQIRFERSGEPMITEEPTIPTPAELESSAKK